MRLPLLVLVAGSLLTAGCGSEGDGDSASKSKPASTATPAKTVGATSEKEWAAEVSAVCKDSQKQTAELARKVQGEGLQGQELAAETLERSLPLLRRLFGELEAVPAPEAIQDDYAAWVKRLRASLPLFEQIGESIRKNQADPELEAEVKDLAADTRPFALEHHLKACLPDQS
jgi:hypothetical protein